MNQMRWMMLKTARAAARARLSIEAVVSRWWPTPCEDEDAAAPAVGHLAVRDDGRILLSTDELSPRTIAGREVSSYVVLSGDEADTVLATARDGLAEVASRTARAVGRARGARSGV